MKDSFIIAALVSASLLSVSCAGPSSKSAASGAVEKNCPEGGCSVCPGCSPSAAPAASTQAAGCPSTGDAAGGKDCPGKIFFGPEGLMPSGEGALAVLLPYEAPAEGLRLASENVEVIGSGQFAITRSILNSSSDTISFNDILRVRDLFRASRYTIPCVNYNGNDFDGGDTIADGVFLGKVNVPTGLSCEGKPWVFSYQRTGIPSCTLTENATTGLALFASNDTPSSLVSSCSLEQEESGQYVHVLVRPVVEAPYTYESKGVFGPRYDEYITLAPGETFTATSYVCVCPPKWEDYATVSLMPQAMELLGTELEPCLTDEQVWALGQRYIRSLLYLYKGKWLISTNRKQRIFHEQHKVLISREEMAERLKWEYWTDIATFDPSFEIGWAGQNFLSARMLAVRAFETSDDALLEKAVGVYDAFLETQRRNGLLHIKYDQNFAEDERKITVDVCNMGWGAAEAVRMYSLLSSHGIEKPELVDFARRICDFFIGRWSDEYGFGKTWTMKGRPVQTKGSIGGFMMPALCELYSVTGEERYLEAAERASDFYYERDMDHFVCTAGAIDCNCIDKETSYPYLQSSLQLYHLTGDAKYLDRAEKAAAYFSSWMFFFDPLYGPETDVVKYNWHVTGGTGVSAEHQCIDAWGGIMAADMYELSELTGNPLWDRLGRLMWAHAVQGITTRLGEFFHDMQRPIGSQNEGFFQARFTKYRPIIEAGYWNDIFVSWPPAYRLWTIDRLRQKGVTIK